MSEPWKTALLAVGCSLGAIILVFGIALILLRRLARRRLRETRVELGAEHILHLSKSANFFGVESAGMSQLRGNGVLTLTPDSLVFKMYLPDREYRIPLDKVLEAGVASSFLDKRVGRPLLVVCFSDEEGAEDSMGLYVPHARRWADWVDEAARALP